MPLNFRMVRLAVRSMLLFGVFWCAGIVGGLQSAVQAAPAPTQAAQAHTIAISGFKFQPDALTVHVGDTVEWKNADIVPHTVTATDHSFNSGRIAPGATWKFVVRKAGTFPYVCTPHPNMHGKLVVQ